MSIKILRAKMQSDNLYQYFNYKGHPLALSNGHVQVHRFTLYTFIGDGPHQCQICKTHINWGSGLEADHIDGNKLNNHPNNLRQVCKPCNLAQRKMMTKTIACEVCGSTSEHRGHRARYCSKACKRSAAVLGRTETVL